MLLYKPTLVVIFLMRMAIGRNIFYKKENDTQALVSPFFSSDSLFTIKRKN